MHITNSCRTAPECMHLMYDWFGQYFPKRQMNEYISCKYKLALEKPYIETLSNASFLPTFVKWIGKYMSLAPHRCSPYYTPNNRIRHIYERMTTSIRMWLVTRSQLTSNIRKYFIVWEESPCSFAPQSERIYAIFIISIFLLKRHVHK